MRILQLPRNSSSVCGLALKDYVKLKTTNCNSGKFHVLNCDSSKFVSLLQVAYQEFQTELGPDIHRCQDLDMI